MAEAVHTEAHTEAAGGAEHHVEATAFGNSLLTPGFFVALAMLTVFAIMLWKRVPALIAAALKAQYEAKAKAADEEIAVLKAAAEKQAADVVAKAKDDAAQLIARHKALSEAKIAAAERAAIDELRAKAASAAAAAASGLIAEQHDAAADRKLVDQAISGL